MKIELNPIHIRRTFSTSSSPQKVTTATNTELAELVREGKNRSSFEEIRGQFRIYRENEGVIILELKRDEDLLDTIEEDLNK